MWECEDAIVVCMYVQVEYASAIESQLELKEEMLVAVQNNLQARDPTVVQPHVYCLLVSDSLIVCVEM